MKIAIAMKAGLTPENSSSDDWILKEALEHKGVTVDLINWRDPSIDLEQYDSIYVSSMWNISCFPEEFLSWLERCDLGKRRLINSAAVLKHGMHKDQYLTFLLNKFGGKDSLEGSITPSIFIRPGQKTESFKSLVAALKKKYSNSDFDDIVMKPIISADGKNTFRFTNNQQLLEKNSTFYRSFQEADSLIHQLLAQNRSPGLILQPFIPFVEQSGEYQLVFLGDEFSHATVKHPGFRNTSFSFRKPVSLDELPPGMLAFAKLIMNYYLEQYPNSITRARLDFFNSDKGPILCEIELVDTITNIRRLSTGQQKLVFQKYSTAIINSTEQLQAMAIIKEVLEEDEHHYLSMMRQAGVRKAIMKIYASYQSTLSHLVDDKIKYNLAVVHGKTYFKACFNDLNCFSNIEAPCYRDKILLIHALDKAQHDYAQRVLSTDRSPTSRAVRLILMAVVNFIAALTLGVAHYLHYQATGRVLFFSETASERQLRQSHRELNNQIERFCLS